jgi:hypothetical protein
MVALILLALPLLFLAIYALQRRDRAQWGTPYELPAALISSGTAGAWVWVVAPVFPSRSGDLTFSSRSPATAEALFGMLVLFFVMSIGPNLLGLTLLRTLLARRPRWLQFCQSGGFVPVGVLYGYAILLVSLAALFPLAVVRPSILLDILAASFFYVPAAASGIVAVGVLVPLERYRPGHLMTRCWRDTVGRRVGSLTTQAERAAAAIASTRAASPASEFPAFAQCECHHQSANSANCAREVPASGFCLNALPPL